MAKKKAEEAVYEEANASVVEETKPAAPQEDPMAALEARIAAMFAAAEEKLAQAEEAQKKAEEMLAEAEAKVSGKHNLSGRSKAINDANEEYVPVKLFKDNDKYKDNVFVSVNGENCVIPRGKLVKIKRKFMKNLELSDLQDTKTAQFMDEEENKYLDEARRLEL